MAADVIRTELKTTEDRRVRAGLRGAIEWLAARHGMSPAEQREFADEVERECDKAVASRAEAGACCDVVIEEQEDQMEVEIRTSSEFSLDALSKSRHAATADSSSAHPDGKHSRRGNAAGRAGDNGHRAVTLTLVRRFHKNPAHS